MTRSNRPVEAVPLPAGGRYRLQILVKGGVGNKHAKLELKVEAAGRLYEVRLRPSSWSHGSKQWHWTRPVTVELPAGAQQIRIVGKGEPTVGLEKVRIEQECQEDARPCQEGAVRR